MDVKQTLTDIVQQLPPSGDVAIKTGGFIGAGTAASGIATIWDPTMITALGVFMGGLASLMTIIYTIYRNRRK